MNLSVRVHRRPDIWVFHLTVMRETRSVLEASFEMPIFGVQARALAHGYGVWESVRLEQQTQTDVGRYLTKLLVPKEMISALGYYAGHGFPLSLVDAQQSLPWELFVLKDHQGQAHFLGDAFAVFRRIPGAAKRLLSRPKKMLTVLAEPARPRWVREAHVLKALANRHGVDSRILRGEFPKSGKDLHETDILFFCGHGWLNRTYMGGSALEISPQNHITPYHLPPLPQCPGPFVFWNACHGGGGNHGRLEQMGWPHALNRWGASGMVGPFWIVQDEWATRLAVDFFKAWFAGEPLERALWHARRKQMGRPEPDRLAYVLYL